MFARLVAAATSMMCHRVTCEAEHRTSPTTSVHSQIDALLLRVKEVYGVPGIQCSVAVDGVIVSQSFERDCGH
jgi:hypothetical protein